MDTDTQIAQFQQFIHQQIPLTNHMGFVGIDYDGRDLAFNLALASNHNDKGTAFAGALSAGANLCGWGAITLLLQSEDQPYDVVIRDSRLEYMLPVTADFRLQTRMPDPEQLQAFTERLRERGKARCDLQVEVIEAGQCCFRFTGSYVALRKKNWG